MEGRRILDKTNATGGASAAPITLKLSKAGAFSLIVLWFFSTYFISNLYGSIHPSGFVATTENTGPSQVSFTYLAHHCANSSPIGSSEFYQRQIALAKALHTLNASGYIAEPGANAHFYGNISKSHWALSERPLLLIITPSITGNDAQANVSILTPQFESARARRLPVPANVQYIEWPEDVNPYKVAASVFSDTAGSIFVDGSIRKFLADGLQEALPEATITTAPLEITQLRERKSGAELDLLKCANEVTLLAIREVHKKMYIGIQESEARTMMASALSDAGLKDGRCLTLFGENAALPHGSGTDRALRKSDFALFDCTASLHGYYSDVTRTVALAESQIPEEHRRIWDYVHSAQTIASQTAREGVLARKVDEAPRAFLEDVGYGRYFTHRLGHGIGLEVHESPYLRGGNMVPIKSGHTFSNEPGVYIEGQVGVRLEDCFFINGKGSPVFLTAGVGGQSAGPLAP